MASGGNGHQDWAAIPIGWGFRLGTTSPFLLLRKNGCLGSPGPWGLTCRVANIWSHPCIFGLSTAASLGNLHCEKGPGEDLPNLWWTEWLGCLDPELPGHRVHRFEEKNLGLISLCAKLIACAKLACAKLACVWLAFGAEEIVLPMTTTFQTFRRGWALFGGNRLETTLTWWSAWLEHCAWPKVLHRPVSGILEMWLRPFERCWRAHCSRKCTCELPTSSSWSQANHMKSSGEPEQFGMKATWQIAYLEESALATLCLESSCSRRDKILTCK